MSDSLQPWSNSSYAPQITPYNYHAEKANFAGYVISAILYGIVIVLFFRCIQALLNPINRFSKGAQWALVIHVTAMFSFATIYTATTFGIQRTAYIDNRAFPGIDGFPPGPWAYEFITLSYAIDAVQFIAFLFNNWLADGLLLYRCFIVYAMNYWVIAFPCLMYLASVSTGVVIVYYQVTQPATGEWSAVAIAFNYPYYSISLSLNVLLTLMITGRLLHQSRKIRSALGPGNSGLYRTIITMLIESSALYAASSLLFLGPWAVLSWIGNAFFLILGEIQVIAPLLIILRVANRRALTSEKPAPGSGNIGTLRFTSRGESTFGEQSIPTESSGSMGFREEKLNGNGTTPGDAIESQVQYVNAH